MTTTIVLGFIIGLIIISIVWYMYKCNSTSLNTIDTFQNQDVIQQCLDICTRNSDVHPFYTEFYKLHNHVLQHAQQAPNVFACPVYYINLSHQTFRNNLMQRQFNSLGISDYHRINAVDGTKNLDKIIINEKEYPVTSTLRLTTNELACTLSHITSIATAYSDAGLPPHAVIMEDDCYFMHASLWPYTVPELFQRVPTDWNIISLYSSSIICGHAWTDDAVSLLKHSQDMSCYMALCYVINREGMQRILEHVGFFQGVIKLDVITPNFYYDGADNFLYTLAKNTYYVKPQTVCSFNDRVHSKSHIQVEWDLNNQLQNSLFVVQHFQKFYNK
jgi:GR25 family glycosyltransferase involved in LPS biosynthesis